MSIPTKYLNVYMCLYLCVSSHKPGFLIQRDYSTVGKHNSCVQLDVFLMKTVAAADV